MQATIANARVDTWVLAAFLVVVLLGGTNFVAVRFSNQELPPFWGAGLRFAAAALVLSAAAALGRFPLPRGRALAGALAYGALGFGAAYALAYWALRSVPAGIAAVVLSSAPLLTVLLAWLHGQQRILWRDLAGAGLTLLGIGVIFGTSANVDLPILPLLGIIAAAMCFAFVLFPLVAIALAAWLEGAPVTASLLLGAGIVLTGVYVGVISQPASRRPCPRMGSEPCMGAVE